MFRKPLTWLLCALWTCGVAWADQPASLTLDEALKQSIEANPQVAAYMAQQEAARAAVLTARARPNPSIMSDNGIAEKTYRLGVQQTLELGGKRKRRVALAQKQAEVSQAEIQGKLLDLRAEVRKAYTRLYNGQERQKVYENILQVTQELSVIAGKRERAGDISKLDVLQADIVRVNANNDLQVAIADVQNTHTRLNALLNQPLETKLQLAPPNTTPRLSREPAAPEAPFQSGQTLHAGISQLDMTLPELITVALRQRPEVELVQRNLETAQLQLALAKVDRIPNLTLAGGPDIVTESGGGEFNAFIIGSMEIPVFNRQQGPIAEAKAHQLQYAAEQLALQNRIRMEVTTAFHSYQANQARIHRYESELLPYSVAVTDKSRRAFQEGKTSVLTPLNAQQAYMNTRLGYLQALMDYQDSISDLERALGAGL